MKITKRSKISSAYDFGGAYDIESDQFFTRDDLVELSNVLDEELAKYGLHVSDIYTVDTFTINVEASDDEGSAYVTSCRVDSRRIRRPADLLKYVPSIVDGIKMQLTDADDVYSSTDLDETARYNWDLNDYAYEKYETFVDDLDDDDYDRLYQEYEKWKRNGEGGPASRRSIASSTIEDDEDLEYVTAEDASENDIDDSDIDDSDIDEDNIDEIEQEYTSKDTAINGPQGKLPAAFKLASIPEGALVLDYGGGKPEAEKVAQSYLDQFDAKELIYDPYNQTSEHNKDVVKQCRSNGGADIAICSNVLNVIMEEDVRQNVLKNIKKLTKPGANIYITVYEGKGSGEGSVTQKGSSYQNNRKTADYLEEIQQVFPDASRRGKLILATNNSDSSEVESATEITSSQSVTSLEDEIKAKAKEVMTDSEFGFDADEADNYLSVDTEDKDGFTEVHVGAEVSYEGLESLAEALNPIIQKYDPDAYFDMEDTGRLVALVANKDNVTSASELTEVDKNIEEEDVYSYETELEFDLDDILTVQDEDVFYFDNVDELGSEDVRDDDHGAKLGDAESIQDNLLEILTPYVPSEPGEYRVTGSAKLVFDVNDVLSSDDDVYTDDADVEFLPNKSTLSNIKVSKVQ